MSQRVHCVISVLETCIRFYRFLENVMKCKLDSSAGRPPSAVNAGFGEAPYEFLERICSIFEVVYVF